MATSINSSVLAKKKTMERQYIFTAMNRFGYGADKTSRQALNNTTSLLGAQKWLINQIRPYELSPTNWSSAIAIRNHIEFDMFKKASLAELSASATENSSAIVDEVKTLRRTLFDKANSLSEHTALANINSDQPFLAKLLDFFSNHFSVSNSNFALNLLCPTLEVEAIAPNLHLKFSDMLISVIQHPAMLIYLNNEYSIGPNSKNALSRKKRNIVAKAGLNENLARELLELHTVGVNAPFTQQDITEVAKAISGWGIGDTKQHDAATFKFRSWSHEPGTRRILNKTYKEETGEKGINQGINILMSLANHPDTAKHICYKIASYFLHDSPPIAVVEAMQRMWMSTKGNLPDVMRTLIMHSASWNIPPKKFKSAREFVISSCRAGGINQPYPSLRKTMDILGEGLFEAGTPAGYAHDEKALLSPSSLNSRMEWAEHFASVIAKHLRISPLAMAQNALGLSLTRRTAQFISRAESKQQAITLFLMSPEFQRR